MRNEEWSGARIAAALARLGDAGYPQPKLARMAGVNQSTVSRWARGERRPGYDAIQRLAAAVWREQPGVARELVEASGYAWSEPPESEPEPLIAPELAEALRKHAPERAGEIIAELEQAELNRRRAAAAGQSAGQEARTGPAAS